MACVAAGRAGGPLFKRLHVCAHTDRKFTSPAAHKLLWVFQLKIRNHKYVVEHIKDKHLIVTFVIKNILSE